MTNGPSDTAVGASLTGFTVTLTVNGPSATAVGAVLGGGLAVNRPSMLSVPPVTVLPVSEVVALALSRIVVRNSEAVEVGLKDFKSAIAPVTWGAAIEVPL